MVNAKKNYALVLGGGGAKGSYQIGAWKALKEAGFHFSAIIGTSVGAINGALIATENLKGAEKLWETITTESVINFPPEFIINGRFTLNNMNINNLKKLQKLIMDNKGLDTEPLKNIMRQCINEKKIRQTGIDFGLVTYDIKNLKPCEIFINDIPDGYLLDYILASATFPGFKLTAIDDKKFIDGGIHDNVPLTLAKERGYRKIIVIDLSSPGFNRKPDIYGLETIYIKNIFDTGGVLDFNPEQARKNINLGYLDALKVLGKISGIHYYYYNENSILHKLEELLFSRSIVPEYLKYLNDKKLKLDQKSLTAGIRKILPVNINHYRNLVIALIECAALTLKIEQQEKYDYKVFIKKIWDQFIIIEKTNNPNENAFNRIIKKIKNPGDIFNLTPLEYENILGYLFNNGNDNLFYTKTLAAFFPCLLPAKIAYTILEKYFKM